MKTEFELVNGHKEKTGWMLFVVETQEPYIIIRNDKDPKGTTMYINSSDLKQLAETLKNIS